MTNTLELTCELTGNDKIRFADLKSKIDSQMPQEIGFLASEHIVVNTDFSLNNRLRRELEIKYWEAGWTIKYSQNCSGEVLELIPGHGGYNDL